MSFGTRSRKGGLFDSLRDEFFKHCRLAISLVVNLCHCAPIANRAAQGLPKNARVSRAAVDVNLIDNYGSKNRAAMPLGIEARDRIAIGTSSQYIVLLPVVARVHFVVFFLFE
jgi:hypothetical protein